ncbi:MAG: TIGR00341 family protein [Bacillota bacterium]
MALRQIQVTVPKRMAQGLREEAAKRGAERVNWLMTGSGQPEDVLMIICNVGTVGPMINLIENHFREEELGQPQIEVLAVEAMIPPAKQEHDGAGRASWEELYHDVMVGASLNKGYVSFVLLAAVLATLGLLADDGAIVIASMVVAPLFGPLMGIALGTVMAERKLVQKALVAELAGVVIALLVGALVGLVVPGFYLLDSGQVQARIQPNLIHIGLAVGAGVAGALSLTSVAMNNLVGVAVAVALMPPAIVTGMGIGQADWTMARGAGLLLAVNILAGLMAATITFRLHRIQPAKRYRIPWADRSTRLVLLLGGLLLVVSAVPLVRWSQDLMALQSARSQVADTLRDLPAHDIRIRGVDIIQAPDRVRVEITAEGSSRVDPVDLEPVKLRMEQHFQRPVEVELRLTPTAVIQVK